MAPVLLNPSRFGGGGGSSGYASAVLADSPAAWWRQNDVPTGAVSGVSGGQALTGTYSAQVTGPLSGSNGLSFAGSHVLYSNVNINHSQFSIEVWIKTTMTGAATIVSNRGRGGGGKSLSLGIGTAPAGGGGAGRLWLGLDSNSLIIGIATTAAVNDGNWHHVVGVWNGTSGVTFATSQLAIYVDGSAAASGTVTAFGSVPAAPLVGADGYILGATTSGPTAYFTGSLSRHALYGSALSGTRVAAHFAATTVSGYDAAVAADSPLGYWPLDTLPTTGVLADSSGNSRPASYTFQPTFDVSGGPKDKDTRWPASDRVYASTAAAVNLSTGSGFTLEAWVYLDALPSGKVTLIGNGANAISSTLSETALYLDASGKPALYAYTGSFVDLVASSALSLNTWHHVVGRAGSGGMQVLVDGTIVATNAVTPLTNYNRVLWLRAGGIDSTGQAVRTAETAAYNTALSDARVIAHRDAA